MLIRRCLSGQLAVLMIAACSGCSEPPPEIARNLYGGTVLKTSHKFDQRVATRFPVGSEEGKMIAELRREHFELTEAADASHYSTARRDIPGLACRDTWNIKWLSRDGKITEIQGGYGQLCL
jgi:hypothetical protein